MGGGGGASLKFLKNANLFTFGGKISRLIEKT